jgi:hypothetical protein
MPTTFCSRRNLIGGDTAEVMVDGVQVKERSWRRGRENVRAINC